VHFRGANDDVAVNAHRILDDFDPPACKVNVPNPQSGSLAPAQTGVDKEVHKVRVLGLGGKNFRLSVRQVCAPGTDPPWQLHLVPAGRVLVQPVIVHGVVEDRCENAVGTGNGRRSPWHKGAFGSNTVLAAKAAEMLTVEDDLPLTGTD
jgi:hypothetical protein